eukprot:jgi/Mesvir1/12064/Mv00350-RA.1
MGGIGNGFRDVGAIGGGSGNANNPQLDRRASRNVEQMDQVESLSDSRQWSRGLIRPPDKIETASLLVAVRLRPLTAKEKAKQVKDILTVLDDKVVIVKDPDESKEYLDRNRSKERRYAFDQAFGPSATSRDVYQYAVVDLAAGVVQGLNATVFAYGATGSGKTHTMVGTREDPGLMLLALEDIFGHISRLASHLTHSYQVFCSYLEVYNEIIFDLLVPNSSPLELREAPGHGVTVAGITQFEVKSTESILELLAAGNSRRKTESTDANDQSSRSHAVLEILVQCSEVNQLHAKVLKGKLSLVDLAGSERAAETNNIGQKLRDGANINRSLLALANCINALGKQQKRGVAYVPYRNSKLTRLLKDGLSGNSRTAMVATVSPGSNQYQHTNNTLKYADRAKEIKTHVAANVSTVDKHVADFQDMIETLQAEVQALKQELANRPPSLGPVSKEEQELTWLDRLSEHIRENVEERVNLQKAVFELEDQNVQNQVLLLQIQDAIRKEEAAQAAEHATGAVASGGEGLGAANGEGPVGGRLDSLRRWLADVTEIMGENEREGEKYRVEIASNEKERRDLQSKMDAANKEGRSAIFLQILSQYRLMATSNMELRFQVAIRDQILSDQEATIQNLWDVLEGTGLSREQLQRIAQEKGVTIDLAPPPGPDTAPAITKPAHAPPVSPRRSATEGAGSTNGVGQLASVRSPSGLTEGMTARGPHIGERAFSGSPLRYRYEYYKSELGQAGVPGGSSGGGAESPTAHMAALGVVFKPAPPIKFSDGTRDGMPSLGGPEQDPFFDFDRRRRGRVSAQLEDQLVGGTRARNPLSQSAEGREALGRGGENGASDGSGGGGSGAEPQAPGEGMMGLYRSKSTGARAFSEDGGSGGGSGVTLPLLPASKRNRGGLGLRDRTPMRTRGNAWDGGQGKDGGASSSSSGDEGGGGGANWRISSGARGGGAGEPEPAKKESDPLRRAAEGARDVRQRQEKLAAHYRDHPFHVTARDAGAAPAPPAGAAPSDVREADAHSPQPGVVQSRASRILNGKGRTDPPTQESPSEVRRASLASLNKKRQDPTSPLASGREPVSPPMRTASLPVSPTTGSSGDETSSHGASGRSVSARNKALALLNRKKSVAAC